MKKAPRDRLLTIADTARILSVSGAHVRHMIDDGIIPHVDAGLSGTKRLIRVRRKDLDSFIRDHVWQGKRIDR